MSAPWRKVRLGLMQPAFVGAAILAFVGGLAITGLGDARQDQRPEFERIAQRLYHGDNPIFGPGPTSLLRDELASGMLDPRQKVQCQLRLAVELNRLGEQSEAVTVIDQALATIRSSSNLGDLLPAALDTRATVYLRSAEIANCIARHNAQCCVFPLQGGGVHQDQGPVQEAAVSLEELLRLTPDNGRARWLLNVAHMALGGYPDAVPERWRIAPEAFESQGPAPRFVDIAPRLGIDAFDLAGGVIADDFDGDGFIDLITSTCDPAGPLKHFRNRGDGGFDTLASATGLDEQLGGLNCVGADYDNDGDIDVLVLRGAWMLEWGLIRNSLLRNDGAGRFTDVTRAAGLADPAYPTQAAAWADFDNDGWLDLYVGNESRAEFLNGKSDWPSQLFHNNGDGTFTDIASAAGVTNNRYAKGVAAGDYDNDGDIDIYVSNLGRNRLYRNDGNSTFTDVAPDLNLTEPSGRSFACWFFDYDNDGWLDLWVTGYDAKVDDVMADYLGQPHRGAVPRLYHNDGDGTFTDAAPALNLNHPYLAMGSNFGDIDNDGWLDMYLGTGDPELTTLVPNIMLRNDRGRVFQDVTTAAGVGHLQKGHGTAFVDLDNDGDQDLYHQLGAFLPTDKFANACFLNPGNENHWITLKLVGAGSNRMAYGARLRLDVRTPSGPRQMHRAVGAVSSFGGSPSRQEIGLGDALAIDRLEVWWPKTGQRQVFDNVPMDAAFFVTEGADRLEPMPYPRIPLTEE